MGMFGDFRRAVLFGIALLGVLTGAVAAQAMSYAEGEDLYRRGFYAEAHDVWLALAQAGDREAQYRLGALFHDGVTVPQDYEKAAYWYKKAANAGNYHAQFDLATLYDMGAGVQQNLKQAAYWYRRAADQGAPAGQYNMAVMLEDGVGVKRDYPDSYFWYDQALRRDFFDIRGGSRERVSAKMTMAEILSTQRRARNWQPVRE